MIRATAFALAVLCGSASAQNAPFCAVSSAGRECFFYDLPTCQQRAEAFRGACVVNGAQQSQGQSSNWFSNATRSYESGRRDREANASPTDAGVSKDAIRQFCRDMQAQDVAELDRMIAQNSPDYDRLLGQWWDRSDRCFALAR